MLKTQNEIEVRLFSMFFVKMSLFEDSKIAKGLDAIHYCSFNSGIRY